jgi:predicted nucleotidyltransferase
MELLEKFGFDLQVAGAGLLGRDVAHLCAPVAMTLIRSALQSEQTFERLVNCMVRTSTVAEALPFAERMLTSFRFGLLNP